MKYFSLVFFFFLFSFAANAQGACSNCGAVYEFHDDGSILNEYHRSYTINVSGTTVKFIVYSFADTLLNEKYTIEIDLLYSFLSDLKSCKLQGVPLNNIVPCSGSTSESFYSGAGFHENIPPFKKVKLKINAAVIHCAGTDNGGVKGNVVNAVALFKSMVPDFEGKRASTLK